MAKVHNTVGSLKSVLSHLHQHKLIEFSSLEDVLHFKENLSLARKQIIQEKENDLRKEIHALTPDILDLETQLATRTSEIENDFVRKIEKLKQKLYALPATYESDWQAFSIYWQKVLLRAGIEIKRYILPYRISFATQKLSSRLEKKRKRYHYLDTHFDDALNTSCKGPLLALEKKRNTVSEIDSFIAGAIGEIKVANELAKLPDNCFLINDFQYTFRKALYSKQNNEYIKSIQIDHLLISPSGIFVIETKNWSEQFTNHEKNLWSPVQQVKRQGYALYRILSFKKSIAPFALATHPWGNRKIPIRNIIVFLQQKPQAEFDFVKLLSLHELHGYLSYFKPIFSNMETEKIAHFLVDLADD